MCEHKDLIISGSADNVVDNVEVAAVVVHCAECNRRFGFRGVPCGASPDIPTRSLDGRMVILPLLTPEELDEMGENAGAQDDPRLAGDSAKVPGWKAPDDTNQDPRDEAP